MKNRSRIIIAAGIIIAVGALCFGSTIQHRLLVALVMRQSAPNQEVAEEMLDSSSAPDRVLHRMWNSGKIPFRVFALDYLKSRANQNPNLIAKLESTVIDAALDPDMSARELALGILAEQKHPRLAELAIAQFDDPDPLIRLMGIQHLKRNGIPFVPDVARMLEDSELQVAASAASTLRAWTGHDFGARMRMTVRDSKTDEIRPENKAALVASLESWKQWWKTNSDAFTEPAAKKSRKEVSDRRFRVRDFSLENLSGERVSLSDFRGKVVLINFWATWCTACLAEIPSLIALQNEYPDQLVVLGVSLDGRPDEHGHAHGESNGHESEGDGDHIENEENHEHETAGEEAEITAIRKKVARFVKSKSITYRVVLNPSGTIGARFNGHELPTNVIIDSNGCFRRRFIGKRSKESLRAIIREAAGDKI